MVATQADQVGRKPMPRPVPSARPKTDVRVLSARLLRRIAARGPPGARNGAAMAAGQHARWPLERPYS